MRARSVRILGIGLAAALVVCSKGGRGDIAGGVDETDTGRGCIVRGAVVFRDSTPVAGADVNLYDQSTLRLIVMGKALAPELIREGYRMTGGDGIFQYDSVDTGRFMVAIDYRDSLGALVPVEIDTADTLVRADAQLGRKGSVDGRVDSALIAGRDSVSLYVPELHLVVPVDSNGAFVIENVPAWNYTVRLVDDRTIVPSPLDTIPIPVSEGDTTVVRNLGGRTGTVIIHGSVVEEP